MSSDRNIFDRADDAISNSLTFREIEAIVRKATKDNQLKVLDYTLDSYSKKKLGFIGRYEKLSIAVKRKNPSRIKKLSFFVKSIPTECLGENKAVKRLFDNETIFFSEIAPMLSENYTGEKWLPACYLIKPGVIVMEDLRQQDFKLRGKNFDDALMLKSALAALARFHACSILAESASSRELPETTNLGACFSQNCQQIGFSFEEDERNWWFIHGVQTTMNVAEHLGYATDKLEEGFARACKAAQPSAKHRNGICHGDIWWNNLMFAGSEKCLKRCVLVDYQTIRYAPLVLDLLQILHCTTSVAFRRENERSLVEFYQSVLEETVMKDDRESRTIVPTLNETLSALKDLRVYGAAIPCLYYPILTDLNKLEEEEKSATSEQKSFMFSDRTRYVLTMMEKNPLFREKIEEAVGEMVRVSEAL